MPGKQLLIFSWEYFGHHSPQGTALSKRPRQVAESFVKKGWDVVVIHRDSTNECGTQAFNIDKETGGITRIPVKMTAPYVDNTGNALLRRLKTLYYVAYKGDRSYRWADDVKRNFDKLGVVIKPDLVMGFFTPRGPLELARYYSKMYGVPWIADIQDPVLSGIQPAMVPMAKKWMHNTMKTAVARVHVSPEWGNEDAAYSGLPFTIIRHAIPNRAVAALRTGKKLFEGYEDCYNIFYGGSLSFVLQSPELLKKAIDKAAEAGIKIMVHVAGDENARNSFVKGIGAANLNYLGWQSSEMVSSYIEACDCTMVIPLSQQKIGIPSKFYELCAYDKPIWVVGYDTGAFISLFREWQHPPIPVGDLEYQAAAIIAASRGDASKLFNLSACKGKYLYADDLYGAYMALVANK